MRNFQSLIKITKIQSIGRFGILCLLWLLTACGGTAGVTVDDEQEAGAEMHQQVEQQIGLYQAEYLALYVDAVGRRLVSELGATPYKFQFKIVDQADPNAFASPGGYVYLSRGILALVNTEDELAGILADHLLNRALVTGRTGSL